MIDFEANTTLSLTEEEAYALLLMCMMSPMRLDPTAEKALRKLAEFCKSRHLYPDSALREDTA